MTHSSIVQLWEILKLCNFLRCFAPWNCSQDFRGKHHPNWSDLKYPTLEPQSIMLTWCFVSKINPSPQNKSLPMNFLLFLQLLNSHTGSEEKGESGVRFNGIWHGWFWIRKLKSVLYVFNEGSDSRQPQVQLLCLFFHELFSKCQSDLAISLTMYLKTSLISKTFLWINCRFSTLCPQFSE